MFALYISFAIFKANNPNMFLKIDHIFYFITLCLPFVCKFTGSNHQEQHPLAQELMSWNKKCLDSLSMKESILGYAFCMYSCFYCNPSGMCSE